MEENAEQPKEPLKERWLIYFLADTQRYYWCEEHDTERVRRYNERMGNSFNNTKGGCCFTSAGICVMAKNSSWMKYGQRKSPLDFDNIDIIMEEEEPMKIRLQSETEEGLKEIRIAMELSVVGNFSKGLANFLGNTYECIEDIFVGDSIVYLLYPNKECAAKIANFVESGEIDNDLTDARWVKVDDRYWLSLNFKEVE